MQDKYQNKYRIPSARLQSWDYSSNGAYYITICTRNREHYFGEIIDGKMQLNQIGKLAEEYWIEISKHFDFVELGNFVIMPNHMHGILIINKPPHNAETRQSLSIQDEIVSSENETRQCLVSTDENKIVGQTRFQNQGKNTISSIVGSYKSIVTKTARNHHADFNWQTRFYDHIIRDAQSFEIIQNYIFENPTKWNNDEFNT